MSLRVKRKTFLSTVGAGITGAVVQNALGAPAQTVAQTRTQPLLAPSQNEGLVDLVNVFQGTDTNYYFSTGNILPLCAMPFGMAHWAIQTNSDSTWYFNPEYRRTEGIRCTHQPGPWLGDYGQATFFPFCGDPPSPDAAERASSYRPQDLKVAPHHTHIELMRFPCSLDLVPTDRCAIMRLTFRNSGKAGLMIDIPSRVEIHSGNHGQFITTVSRSSANPVGENFGTYYAIRIETPVKSFTIPTPKSQNTVAIVQFEAEAGRPIDIRIGTSFISVDQAVRNLNREVAHKSFEELRRAGASAWNRQLGRVRVEGGTSTQQKVFYSTLFRASLFPRIWYEFDHSNNPIHYSNFNSRVMPGYMYADQVFWDVWHAWYPMMSVLYPERLSEVLQGWENVVKEGGYLPQAPVPGYGGAMTGNLIESAVADGIVKKIPNIDVELLYRALKETATGPGNPDAGYGRKGFAEYIKYGYIPSDVYQGPATSQTLDLAYGDFCVAQVARLVGQEADAQMFERRAENWRNVYDPSVRFMRGRKADGSWNEPFDQFAWAGPFVEGSAWQHRFALPHNPQGLIAAMGGKAAVAMELEKMMTMRPFINANTNDFEPHEISEMLAVDFGQYDQGNEPVHSFLPYFAEAGRPDRLQYWMRQVLDKLYTVDTFPGDEDTGAMAAWYVIAALGFFPGCPGRLRYTLSSPQFDRAVITAADGRQTIIEAQNNSSQNLFVTNCLVNGQTHRGIYLDHQTLTSETMLTFTMAETPTG